MKIGYARVSTPSQNLDRQIAALRAEGCEKVFSDKASGKSLKGRPQLEKAIDALGTEYILVIAEWDRATRSMMDGVKIMQRIADRKAMVKVLDKPHLDLTTTLGKGFLMLFSSMAEDERERLIRRAEEGRAIAKDKGVKFGRKSKLTDHQRELAFERLGNGDSVRQIAKDMGVAPSTISRLN